MFRATGVDESEVAALGEDWRWLQEYERAARHELWAGAIITLGVRAERAIRDTLAANGVDPGSEHALGALVGELHKLKRPTRSLRCARRAIVTTWIGAS
jgi:HEPN domain-containing protein